MTEDRPAASVDFTSAFCGKRFEDMAGILTLQEVKRACWKDAQRLKNLHCLLYTSVERATENSATVSDEVDTADNSDPHMGTTYYMYLAPDIVATNPPDMGVSGPSTDALILLAVAVGCAYLCVSAYAHGGKDEQAADAV